jgi:excisionase family DNA binding protein
MPTTDPPLLPAARPSGSPWSLADAATFLGVSARHLARLIESKAVKSFRLGRRVLIADAEVRRVAEHGTGAR